MKKTKGRVINKKVKDLGMLISILNDIEVYRGSYLGEIEFNYYVSHNEDGYNIKIVFDG